VGGKAVFSAKTFRVEVGSRTFGSRLLDRYDGVSGKITSLFADADIKGKIIRPPVDLWSDFSRDVEGSVRDYGGEVTRAIKPFFPDSVMLFEAARRGKEAGLMHPWSTETTTLVDGSAILRDVLFEKKPGSDTVYQPKRHPMAARYFHIDLGVSGDPAAFVAVHTAGWRGIFHSNTRIDKPIIEVDMVLRMPPPTGGRLNFASLRGIVMMLREHGMWFAGGSLDQFQSEDTIQILNSSGIFTKRIADDIAQYLVLKDALFEERLLMYEYEPLLDELLKLEDRSGKIDHPPGMHNDCAAALAHACYNLEMAELQGSPSQLDSRLPALPISDSVPTIAKARQSMEEDLREFLGGSKIIRR
jgi:hypothetical protein